MLGILPGDILLSTILSKQSTSLDDLYPARMGSQSRNLSRKRKGEGGGGAEGERGGEEGGEGEGEGGGGEDREGKGETERAH